MLFGSGLGISASPAKWVLAVRNQPIDEKTYHVVRGVSLTVFRNVLENCLDRPLDQEASKQIGINPILGELLDGSCEHYEWFRPAGDYLLNLLDKGHDCGEDRLVHTARRARTT